MAAVLYGATDTGTPGDLYRVDPATAALTSVGAIGFCVQALAEDPTTGILYGIVADDDPTNANWLITIDKTTGAGTLIGDTTEGAIFDLAFSSAGVLYGVQDFIRRLYTFDLVTGAGTLVGALAGSSPNASTIAGTSADAFYGMFPGWLDGGDLRTIDVVTPGSASAAATSTSIDPDLYAMAASFDPGDVLYVSCDVDGSSQYLVTLDVVAGVVTEVGPTGALMRGLSWGTGTGGGDTTPPTLVSAKVVRDTITLTYDEALQVSPGPDTSEFVVTVNGFARTVTAAVADGSTVVLTLASPVVHGDDVKVSYTA